MPSEWVARILDLYSLTSGQKQEFDSAVAESENGVGVKFAGLSEENKKLSVAFARKSELFASRRHPRLERFHKDAIAALTSYSDAMAYSLPLRTDRIRSRNMSFIFAIV